MASFKEIVVVLLVVGAVAALGQIQASSQETSGEKGETKGLRQQKGPVGPEGPIFPVGQKGPGEGDDWDLDSDIGFPEKGAYLGGLPAHRNARSARSAGPPGPAMSAGPPGPAISADIPPAR